MFLRMVGRHLLGLEVGPSYLSSILVYARVIMTQGPNMILTTDSPLPRGLKLAKRASIPSLEYVSPTSWRGVCMHIRNVDSEI